jgi:hypothetical protein
MKKIEITMNTWDCHVKNDARDLHVENWNVTIKNRDALASSCIQNWDL